jgi:riboflavin kinase/FMN adenylyltransferase
MHFTAHSVSGSGRGKDLKVPTINLEMSEVPDGIEDGLYACTINNDTPAILHYGIRPTFEDTPSCEVHIIDADIAEAPSELNVEIVQKIRETKKFDSAEELMEQMQKDISSARGILGIA